MSTEIFKFKVNDKTLFSEDYELEGFFDDFWHIRKPRTIRDLY